VQTVRAKQRQLDAGPASRPQSQYGREAGYVIGDRPLFALLPVCH